MQKYRKQCLAKARKLVRSCMAAPFRSTQSQQAFTGPQTEEQVNKMRHSYATGHHRAMERGEGPTQAIMRANLENRVFNERSQAQEPTDVHVTTCLHMCGRFQIDNNSVWRGSRWWVPGAGGGGLSARPLAFCVL